MTRHRRPALDRRAANPTGSQQLGGAPAMNRMESTPLQAYVSAHTISIESYATVGLQLDSPSSGARPHGISMLPGGLYRGEYRHLQQRLDGCRERDARHIDLTGAFREGGAGGRTGSTRSLRSATK